MVFGNLTLFNLLHPSKVLSSIFFTPSGIVIPVRLLHPLNALAPILLMVFGSVILFNFLQSPNAYLPMLFTPSGIETLVILPSL